MQRQPVPISRAGNLTSAGLMILLCGQFAPAADPTKADATLSEALSKQVKTEVSANSSSSYGTRTAWQQWRHKDGRAADLSLCAVSKGIVVFQLSQGGFAWMQCAHLDELSQARLREISGAAPDRDVSAIAFGSRTEFRQWKDWYGRTSELALCAADQSMAVFLDRTGTFRIYSKDVLAADFEAQVAELNARPANAKVHYVSQVAAADRLAMLHKGLNDRKAEYIALGTQHCGVTAATGEEWFARLVEGLTEAGGEVRWVIPVANESQVGGAANAFRDRLVKELYSLLELETKAYDELVARTRVTAIAPVDELRLTANTGTSVSRGGRATLTKSMLSFSAGKLPASVIIYSITSMVSGGRIELTPGVSVTSFTQSDIDQGRVSLVIDSRSEGGAVALEVAAGNSMPQQIAFQIRITNSNPPTTCGSQPAVVCCEPVVCCPTGYMRCRMFSRGCR